MDYCLIALMNSEPRDRKIGKQSMRHSPQSQTIGICYDTRQHSSAQGSVEDARAHLTFEGIAKNRLRQVLEDFEYSSTGRVEFNQLLDVMFGIFPPELI